MPVSLTVLRSNRDYEKLLLDKQGFFKAVSPEKQAGRLTDTALGQAQIAIDAAS
jgi:hypothetical protein